MIFGLDNPSKLSRIAFSMKRLQLGFKNVLITNGLILEFLRWNVPFFVALIPAWIEFCKNCSIVFFLDDMEYFPYLVWGVILCVLQMCPYSIVIGSSYIDWWLMSFISAILHCFRCLSTLEPFFCKCWWMKASITCDIG